MDLFKYLADEFQALVYEFLCIPTEILTNTLTKFYRYSETSILKIHDIQIRELILLLIKHWVQNTAFHKLCIVKLLRNTE